MAETKESILNALLKQDIEYRIKVIEMTNKARRHMNIPEINCIEMDQGKKNPPIQITLDELKAELELRPIDEKRTRQKTEKQKEQEPVEEPS